MKKAPKFIDDTKLITMKLSEEALKEKFEIARSLLSATPVVIIIKPADIFVAIIENVDKKGWYDVYINNQLVTPEGVPYERIPDIHLSYYESISMMAKSEYLR